MRAKLIKFGKVGISIVLFYLLIRGVSWVELYAAFVDANFIWFFFALIAGLGQISISAWRWQRILIVLGSPLIALPKLMYFYFLGFFFNNFAPANLAGDFARAGVLYRGGDSGKISAVSVLLERFFNLLGLGIVVLWAVNFDMFPISLQLNWKIVSLIALFLLVLLVLFFLIETKYGLKGKVSVILGNISTKIITENPIELAKIFVSTMLLHFVIMLITFFNSKALLIDLPIKYQFGVYAVSGLAVALPISVQGIGVRESVYTYLFSKMGIPVPQVLAALALNYAVLVLFSVPGGLFFISRPSPNTSKAG